MTHLDEFLENLGECLYIQRTASIRQQKKQKKSISLTSKGTRILTAKEKEIELVDGAWRFGDVVRT
jgi:predicted transcriptional regulator